MEDTAASASAASDGMFLVEKIVAKKAIKGVDHYLIKWLGYDNKENTWEPLSNLETCLALVDEFNRRLSSGKPVKAKNGRVKRLLKREPGAHNLTLNPAPKRKSSRVSLPSRLSSLNSNSFTSAEDLETPPAEMASQKTDEPAASQQSASANANAFDINHELAKARELQFDPGLEPERIIGVMPATDASAKGYYLAMRWKNPKDKDQTVTLMTSSFAKQHYPQLVIQFYQSRLNFEE